MLCLRYFPIDPRPTDPRSIPVEGLLIKNTGQESTLYRRIGVFGTEFSIRTLSALLELLGLPLELVNTLNANSSVDRPIDQWSYSEREVVCTRLHNYTKPFAEEITII